MIVRIARFVRVVSGRAALQDRARLCNTLRWVTTRTVVIERARALVAARDEPIALEVIPGCAEESSVAAVALQRSNARHAARTQTGGREGEGGRVEGREAACAQKHMSSAESGSAIEAFVAMHMRSEAASAPPNAQQQPQLDCAGAVRHAAKEPIDRLARRGRLHVVCHT